jgi:hypothetical protein
VQLHRTSSRSMIFQRQDCRDFGLGAERIISTYFPELKIPATATAQSLKSFMLAASRKMATLVICLGTVLAITSICAADDKGQIQSCSENSITASAPQAGESSLTAKDFEPGKARSIRLTWNASMPASSAPRDVVQGYNIFRHEPGDACEHNPSTCHRINNKGYLVPGASCVDHEVQSGHTYIYQAQGVSVSGAAGKLSNVAKAKLP